MVVIGKEKIRDELVYVKPRFYIRRHIAEVVKCPTCGMDESRDDDLQDIEKCHIRTAEVPAPMIQHSFCTPELLAHIVYEKYCNAMPLNRLEKDFKAKGVNLSSTTIANYCVPHTFHGNTSGYIHQLRYNGSISPHLLHMMWGHISRQSVLSVRDIPL